MTENSRQQKPPSPSRSTTPSADLGEPLRGRIFLLFVFGVVITGAGQAAPWLANPSSLAVDLGVEIIASAVALAALAFRRDRRRCERPSGTDDGAQENYPASEAPEQRYRMAFADRWISSSRYHYLGGNAFFSSFRVLELSRGGLYQPEEINLCIVDPTADRAVAITAERLNKSSEEFRLETYIALSALHDSDHHRLKVYLYDEPIGIRCEQLDQGLFVSRYEGRANFDESDLYPEHSETYRRREAEMRRARARAINVLDFSADQCPGERVRGDEALQGVLASLGYCGTLPELRTERGRRFDELHRQVRPLLEHGTGYF